MATPSSKDGNSKELANVLTGIQTALATLSTRIGQNEEDYKRLSRDQAKLSEAVERGFTELRQAIAARDKTPWGIIISGFTATLAVAVAIGSLALSPLRDKDATLAAELYEQRQSARQYPSREEMDAAIRAAVAEARPGSK